jgi:hypothetical protein
MQEVHPRFAVLFQGIIFAEHTTVVPFLSISLLMVVLYW